MDTVGDLVERGGFAVKGVIRNGQVVLDAPLDLPDGTPITVKEFDESDYPAVWEQPTPEQQRAIRADLDYLRVKARHRAAPGSGQEAA
ncbi:MAG TPA: hypothetical protein VH092_01625 [Urbifossiella sp.]|jgi:hypothetical protein|nr:hypothetical protein [Urbifossiella sp.]